MNAMRDWLAEFDQDDFLGTGLNARQVGHLAGALFLALFAVSALRRITRVGGPWPALWIIATVGLFAAAVRVAAHGFPDQVPEDLQPWTQPDRLVRAATVVGLLGVSIVFLSGYWLRRPQAKFGSRILGLALLGVAVWLAAGWFADQLPDDARPSAARPVVTRGLVVLAGLWLAGTFWLRRAGVKPYIHWANRTVAVPTAATAIALAIGWFGPAVWAELPVAEARQVVLVLAAVATGTCSMVAAGAYLLRDRPSRMPRPGRTASISREPSRLAARPLPVAVLLDDRGRPVLPGEPPHAGA